MSYYDDQLKPHINADHLKIQLFSDNGKTRWLNINLDSINALMSFFEIERKKCTDKLTTHYLMNPATGSVDTRENWVADMENWSDNPIEQQRQLDTLIEVKRINDEWVEV